MLVRRRRYIVPLLLQTCLVEDHTQHVRLIKANACQLLAQRGSFRDDPTPRPPRWRRAYGPHSARLPPSTVTADPPRRSCTCCAAPRADHAFAPTDPACQAARHCRNSRSGESQGPSVRSWQTMAGSKARPFRISRQPGSVLPVSFRLSDACRKSQSNRIVRPFVCASNCARFAAIVDAPAPGEFDIQPITLMSRERMC